MDVSSGPDAAPRRRLTEAELCRWVGQAVPGDTLVYHRGFLAIDACGPGLDERGRRDLLRVAGRARSLAAQGAVHLLQRRHGPHDFAYMLLVRPRPVDVGRAPNAARGPSGLSGARPPAFPRRALNPET